MHRFLNRLLLALGLVGISVFSAQPANAQSNVRVLRLAMGNPAQDPNAITVRDVVNKILAQRTGGRLRIDVYTDGQLGTVAACVQGVETGTIDFDIPGSSYLGGIVPQIQAFELPFIFQSPAEAYAAVVQGPAGQTVTKMIAATGTMQNLAWWNMGVRDLANNKRPVNSLADLKGLKMRTLPGPTQLATWQALGAQPIGMDPNEIYSALSSGTINGVENVLSIIYGSKWYELLKYVTLTNHEITTTPVLASARTMNSLSPQDRAAVQYAFQQATTSEWKLANDDFLISVNELKKAGLHVDENPDRAAFRAQVKPIYDTYRQKYGTQVLDQILASNAQWEKAKH